MTIENLQTCINAIKKRPVTVEMMTHPGYALTDSSDWHTQGCSDVIGPDDFSKSPDRDHERIVLQSGEFRDFLTRNEIQLKQFSEMDL